MKEKILTVTIPIYQIEAYLRQCLKSFVIKEIMDDVEVLMINDGSQDGSAAIAEEFQRLYPETFMLVNKENGGHGSAINKGIELARGTYFKVVDGDDWVNPSAFIRLIEVLKGSNADVVASNYYWYDQKTKKTKVQEVHPFPEVVYEKEYLFSDICDKVFIKMHSMTIKTAILKDHRLRITEHCFYVDMEYVVYPIPFVNTVVFLNEYVYLYRIGLPSQSMNLSKMRKQVDQHGRVLEHLLELYKSEGLNSAAGIYIRNAANRMAASQYKIYLSFGAGKEAKAALVEFDKRMLERFPEVYKAQSNRWVRLLRKSGFCLYSAAALGFMLKEKLR